jgi:hypothetical protein
VFIARRAIFVFVVFLMRDKGFFCVLVIMGFQLLFMLYNTSVQPLKTAESSGSHKLEIMNNWTIMITIYHLILFTDIINDSKIRYKLGWGIVGVQGLNLTISLTSVFIETVKGIMLKCRECVNKRK